MELRRRIIRYRRNNEVTIMTQSTNGSSARLNDQRAPRRPKSKVTDAVLALLQQEARPLQIGKIVRILSARLDGINPHSIYTSIYRLVEEQRIDVIDRDGKRYYAHHGVDASAPEESAPEDTTAHATRSAIIDLLSNAKEPILLSDAADRIAEERGIAKKNAYTAIARLVHDGRAKEHVIHRRRHVALVRSAPVEAPALAMDPIAMASLQSRHIPALQPTQRRVRPEPFDPAVAYAPEIAPDQIALPDTPHFIDCALKIAGLDITARITLDLPNTLAREATFRYLVRVVGELERISSDVLGIGAMAGQLAAALQLAEEEESKRKRLAERLGMLRQALAQENES